MTPYYIFARARLFQPLTEVYLIQVSPHHRDTVVVLPGWVALHGEGRVAVRRLLEGDASVPAGSLQVTADDDNLRLAVGAQHVVEERVAATQGVPQDEDALGMRQGIRGAVPRGDILARDDGLQLQRWHERRDGDGHAVALQAQLARQAVFEKPREVKAVDVLHPQVVLVLDVHVVGQVAVEVNRRGRGGLRQGGVIEGDDPRPLLAAQLAVYRQRGVALTAGRHRLLLVDEVGPQRPGDVEVDLHLAPLVGEETVEMPRQELPDVEQVGVHVAQDGVLRVVQAGLQDVLDDALERLGVVDAGEIDDGLLGGVDARHLADELLRLPVDGGPGFHLGNLAEKADDEPPHLALPLVKPLVPFQLLGDTGADGLALAVKVVGETLDGVVHEPGVAEAQALEPLAQGDVHRLALLGLQPLGYFGHKAARRGKAGGGVHPAAQDHHGLGDGRLPRGNGLPVIVVLDGLRGGGEHLVVAAVDIYVRFHLRLGVCRQ